MKIYYSEKFLPRILGYPLDELETATRAFVSELVTTHAPGYILSNMKVKMKTSKTYMRHQRGRSKFHYSMVLGMQRVLGHCVPGLNEYPSLRERVYNYDKFGLTATCSNYYKGLRCYNAILLHEMAHMLCHVHNCGEGHDDGFLSMYNYLLREHESVDRSVLGVLNTHDELRAGVVVEDDTFYQTRIEVQTKKWSDK